MICCSCWSHEPLRTLACHVQPTRMHLACRRLLDMGLRDVLEHSDGTTGGAGEEDENGHEPKKSAKQQRQEEAAVGTRQLTSFFGIPA